MGAHLLSLPRRNRSGQPIRACLLPCSRSTKRLVETVEMGMSGVMDLLCDISSDLQVIEHFMDEDKSDREASAAWRQKTPSCSRPAPRTSRGCSHCQATSKDVGNKAAPAAVEDISEIIREKVTHSICQAAILDLDTTDEESVSKEEPTHEPKRKTLKSGILQSFTK